MKGSVQTKPQDVDELLAQIYLPCVVYPLGYLVAAAGYTCNGCPRGQWGEHRKCCPLAPLNYRH